MPSPRRPLDQAELGAYFALTEVAALLQYAVEQQLREVGGLSWVQFQLLARLGLDAPSGSRRMTELADGVVYSRSGLTYQAGLLEKAGLVERSRAADDERGVTVTITEAGRALLAEVLPGHVDVVRQALIDPLSRADVRALTDLLEPVRTHLRAAPPRSTTSRRRGGGATPRVTGAAGRP